MDSGAGLAALGGELLTLPPSGHAASHRRESATFHRIVQGFELDAFIHPPQGAENKLICQPRVLGEQGAVQIGTVRVEATGPLGAILTVVAVTHNDFSEGIHAFTEVGPTAVVLEADYLVRLAGLRGPDADQHVPDQTLFFRFPRLCMQVEDADAGELLAFRSLIVVAHELVATAHPEDHAAVFHYSPQIRALGAREVFCEQCLFPVLAAAEEEEVAAGRPYPLPEANVDDLYGNAAPLAALLDGDNISPVAIEVHHVSVKVVDG